MNVLSNSEAQKAITASLFKPDAFGTLAACQKERLDRGKYQGSIIGREVPETTAKGVRLVWAVKRKDQHGEYYALWCIPAPTLPKVSPENIVKARDAGYAAAVTRRPRAPAACTIYNGLVEGFAVGEGGDVLAYHWLDGFQAYCDEQADLILQRSA